jgi:ubiquinone/menaquinone biosynthesis C-methylase UbiE
LRFETRNLKFWFVTSEYTFRLNESELARYRAMADCALKAEADLWQLAGIGPNRSVLDLGCGPGIFLPILAEKTAPHGRVVAVERSDESCNAARALLRATGLEKRVELVQADAAATGLAQYNFDVVMIRNVLIHNGARLGEILNHVRDLLRVDGRLLSVEISADDLVLGNAAAEDLELEQRWATMMRAQGNDPNIGRTLADELRRHRFEPIATRIHVDQISVERSPTWTAREMLVAHGFASEDEVRRWDAAIERRLKTSGVLQGKAPFTVVVAKPVRP